MFRGSWRPGSRAPPASFVRPRHERQRLRFALLNTEAMRAAGSARCSPRLTPPSDRLYRSSVICKKGGRRQLGGRRVPRGKSTGLDFAGSGFDRRRRRTQPDTIQAFLIAIFFSLFCACTVLGSVTVSTPFL